MQDNPTKYTVFMSLNRLKKKKLITTKASKQEDICIYIDIKFSGHLEKIRFKSNKIRYNKNEINTIKEKLKH